MKVLFLKILLSVFALLCFSCSSSGQNIASKQMINKEQVNKYSHKTVADFGARLDGVTDDSRAIQASLENTGYAYIPYTKEGIRIDKTIHIKNGQRVEGATRGVNIISGIKKGEYTFIIANIPFNGSAYLQNFSLSFVNTGANGIKITESRFANILDFSIVGKKKCGIGIYIEGIEKGSAWNIIDRYSISSCTVAAIKLESFNKNPFVNRNYIGFGVAQSCEIGLWIKRGGTNTSLINPQNCNIGILIDEQSHSNRIDTFMESCDVSIDIRGASRNNLISGNLSVKKLGAQGKNTVWNLTKPKMRELNIED